MDLAYDICLVELASPIVESEVVGFAHLPAVAEVKRVTDMFDCKIWGS